MPGQGLPWTEIQAKFKRTLRWRQGLPSDDAASFVQSTAQYGELNMKIVVIGGSGLIGSNVVSRLRQKGHEVVAASPNTGVNTLTGEGLAEAR
jgi:phosphoglycerate dehydrogenase-like enzyme